MLKNKQLKIVLQLLVGIGVLTIFSIVANILLLQQNKKITADQKHLEEKFALLGQEQFNLAKQIDFVADAANASLEDLELLRSETEEQLASAQTALDEAQDNLRDELAESIQSSNERVASVVEEWDSVVAMIECQETSSKSRGGGMLFTIDGVVSLVTNRHVIADNNDVLTEECEVTFPAGGASDFTFTPDDLTFDSEGSDLAIVKVPNPDSATRQESKSDAEWCSIEPSIGAQIVILGYPAIGAKKSLTATEGIISGYDNDYFISSAKVDKGNSGGAAIWLENNCYLGIPTKVFAGTAETLARILDMQAIEF